MTVRDDKEILEDILERIDRVREFTKSGKDAFFGDRKTMDAVTFNLQAIGQAVKDLSEATKKQHPDVEWKDAAKFRDKVAHHYFDIDYEKVWRVVENKLGPLRQKVEDIHQRLVYKVPVDRTQPSSLRQKIAEKRKMQQEKQRDRSDDDLIR